MNVIYLDQNVVINLAERSEQDERFARAREAVLKQVGTNSAVFLYSGVHFAESSAMSPESQTRVGEFFDRISAGHRFASGKYIRSEQFKERGSVFGTTQSKWKGPFLRDRSAHFSPEPSNLSMEPTAPAALNSTRFSDYVHFVFVNRKNVIHLFYLLGGQ
jgi:hypothetical protein